MSRCLRAPPAILRSHHGAPTNTALEKRDTRVVVDAPAPLPPDDLQRAGRELWRTTVGAGWTLHPHEVPVLVAMCRTVDQLEAMAAVLARGDVLDDEGRPSRALVEHRLLTAALVKLAAALKVESEPTAKPPRTYGYWSGRYGRPHVA
jgi:hypothetical protein